jgi:hypothetical protein
MEVLTYKNFSDLLSKSEVLKSSWGFKVIRSDNVTYNCLLVSNYGGGSLVNYWYVRKVGL